MAVLVLDVIYLAVLLALRLVWGKNDSEPQREWRLAVYLGCAAIDAGLTVGASQICWPANAPFLDASSLPA